MSFEHKYLKYKQKYLELKEQLKTLQQEGGASNSDSVLDLEKLTETPKNDAEQLGGYLIDSTESSVLKNSETESEMNINELTETPEENKMVVNLDSSDEQLEESNIESEKETSEKEESEKEESEKESSSEDEQEGGNLDTSISELDEIFSQLGGKKKSNDSSDSDSSMTSLSDIEDSSDFDL